MVDWWNCPEAIGGHDADASGRCRWCRQRMHGPAPKPDESRMQVSYLSRAYAYHYDPDYGTETHERNVYAP